MLSLQVIGWFAPRAESGALGRTRPGRGFTLIELMVVVAIVAILAAIAYPSYRSQVEKTRRADAEAVLMQAAQYLERVYTEGGCYTKDGNLCNCADAFPFSKSPIDGTQNYYGIALTNSTETTFTLTATPNAAGPEKDAGVLTLDQTGRRGRDRNADGNTTDAGEDSW